MPKKTIHPENEVSHCTKYSFLTVSSALLPNSRNPHLLPRRSRLPSPSLDTLSMRDVPSPKHALLFLQALALTIAIHNTQQPLFQVSRTKSSQLRLDQTRITCSLYTTVLHTPICSHILHVLHTPRHQHTTQHPIILDTIFLSHKHIQRPPSQLSPQLFS